jgi:hypothetical protein
MSLTKEEIKSIREYKDIKYYTTENRKITLNLRDILKYVIYWKNLINNYKGEIRVYSSSVGVVSYKQLEQISDEELDDKSPKGILKLQSYMFMNDNNFSKDEIGLVKSYIENYSSFINYLEYKNAIYLSVALLCIGKDIQEGEEIRDEEAAMISIIEDQGGDELRYDDSDAEDQGDEMGYSDMEEEGDFGDEW